MLTPMIHFLSVPNTPSQLPLLMLGGLLSADTMKGDVFQTDALVFAKIRGYPAWPAKVSDSSEPISMTTCAHAWHQDIFCVTTVCDGVLDFVA